LLDKVLLAFTVS